MGVDWGIHAKKFGWQRQCGCVRRGMFNPAKRMAHTSGRG
jgi:hypothetical protein